MIISDSAPATWASQRRASYHRTLVRGVAISSRSAPFAVWAMGIGFLFTAPALAQRLPAEFEERIVRLCTAAAESQPPSAVEYEKVVAELVPFMGATAIADREPAQQALERLAVSAGRPGNEAARAAFSRAAAMQLGTVSPAAARIWILRHLGVVGGAECFPEIAVCLRDGNATVRDAARRALVQMRSPDALNALSNALADADESAWKVALINSLAEFDPPPARVIAPYHHDPDEDVAVATILALSRCREQDAAIPLFFQYRNEQLSPRGEVAVQSAILRLAEEFRMANDENQATKIYKLILSGPAFPPVRAAVIWGRTQQVREHYTADLLAYVQSQDAELLRKTAARLLVWLPDPRVGESVAKRVMTSDPPARALFLDVLADRGETEHVAVVESALIIGRDPAVRLAATRALGRLGSDGQVRMLAALATETNRELRDAARAGLIELRGDAVDAKLLLEAQSGKAEERAECLRAIEKRACVRPIDALLSLAKDPEEVVASAAFDALGSLAPATAVPQVLALAVAAPEAVSKSAESALVHVAMRVAEPDKRATPVIEALSAANTESRPRLARVLGRIGGKEALASLRSLLKNESDAPTYDAAVRAVADWPTADVISDLLQLSASTSDRAHRVIALRGLVRVLRLPNDRSLEDSVKLGEAALERAAPLDEKKLVLSAIGDVGHPRALELAQGMIADDALAGEACAATVAVARRLAARSPEATTAALAAVRACGKASEAARQDADAIEKRMAERKGFIAKWEVSGPYFAAGLKAADLYEHGFPPEAAIGADALASQPDWKPLTAARSDDPWIFDFTQIDKGDDRCMYVRATFRAPTAGAATLDLGSDDGLKVWLNGTMIHAKPGVRSLQVGDDKVPVELKAGQNTLLLKIVQSSGGWEFCCAVRTADGAPLAIEE